MPIELETPFVQPEKVIPAKTADSVWIKGLVITSPDPARPINVQVGVAPMVSATGEVLHGQTKTIEVKDLEAAAKADPVLAAAMQAVFAAVQKLVTDGNTFAK